MRTAGIKLIELVVVLLIILLLANIVFVLASEVRKRAYEAPCMANLRQIYIAWRNYVDDHNEAIPTEFYKIHPYLKSTEVLKCPRDTFGGVAMASTRQWSTPVSYFYLPSDEEFRTQIQQADPNHGILYCVLHGRSRITTEALSRESPAYLTSGIVLRLRRDGSIQRANVHSVCYQDADGGVARIRHPWHLLTDERPCPTELCRYSPEQEIPCPFSFF